MKITHFANVIGDQDGAIYGNLLFRISAKGRCKVYDLDGALDGEDVKSIEYSSIFTLDRADEIVPHSNAVVFGKEKYDEADEFPLLYSNIYNNYAKSDDKMCATLCVYRIRRTEDGFGSTLVGIINVGFTDECGYWRSEEGVADVRPYGNFVIDTADDKLYAFVMRDGDRTTRYFEFKLPSLADATDERLGVKSITLTKSDVIRYFDVPYHRYIQGACFKNGMVYSVEGFGERVHPVLRIIDVLAEKQVLCRDLFEMGIVGEAEFIDFLGDVCIYGDASGHLYRVELDDDEIG